MDLSKLIPVDVNKRSSEDLTYFEKSNRFVLSQKVIVQNDLQDKGFNVLATPGENDQKTFVFKVVPKEEANIHTGKGDSFTSKGLVEQLELSENSYWNLERAETEEDIYLILSPIHEIRGVINNYTTVEDRSEWPPTINSEHENGANTEDSVALADPQLEEKHNSF